MGIATDPLSERLQQWTSARARSDALLDLVGNERLSERPIPDRHRFIFYLGHLEAFDWNLLSPRFEGARAPCELDSLFAFGIDPEHSGVPRGQPEDWPDTTRVQAYNRDVRLDLERMVAAAARASNATDAITPTLLDIAIEHRLMHAETLGYMLAQSVTQRRLRDALPVQPHAPADMIGIPAGSATLGVARSVHGGFAWDNEYEEHAVQVPEFEIARCMTTNGEYLRFLNAGGYERPEHWSPEAWQWRCREKIDHPACWIMHGARWHFRLLSAWVPLPLDWPVYVSQAEASAYARWSGVQLPTEAQWHRAAFGTPAGDERPYPWGNAEPATRHGNFNFRSGEPQDVDADPDGDSAFGVRGLLGNGWEWTRSVFAPFAGFRPTAFYPGYSADFFDGSHYVLKGGSPLTATRLLRRSFRNWFRPHYPYVFAGFRCVRN